MQVTQTLPFYHSNPSRISHHHSCPHAPLTRPSSDLSPTVYHPRSPTTSPTAARTQKANKHKSIKNFKKLKKKGKTEPLKSNKSYCADLLMCTRHCKPLKRTLHCTSLIYRRSDSFHQVTLCLHIQDLPGVCNQARACSCKC